MRATGPGSRVAARAGDRDVVSLLEFAGRPLVQLPPLQETGSCGRRHRNRPEPSSLLLGLLEHCAGHDVQCLSLPLGYKCLWQDLGPTMMIHGRQPQHRMGTPSCLSVSSYTHWCVPTNPKQFICIFKLALCSYYKYEEIENQRCSLACSKSHNWSLSSRE